MIYRELTVGPRDLLAMLLAGRWVFVLTSLVVFVMVSTLVLLLPETYESTGVIQGAKHSAYFEDPDSIVARLLIKHKALVSARLQRHSIFILKTRAESAVRARDMLVQIINDLKQEYNLSSVPLMEFHGAKISVITVQIEEYEQRIDRLNNLIENADSIEQAKLELWRETSSVLMIQRFNLLRKKLEFEEDRLKLITLPRIITPPTISELPVWPQPKRVLTIGAALAVFLGTIAAFLVGYVKYLRQQA